LNPPTATVTSVQVAPPSVSLEVGKRASVTAKALDAAGNPLGVTITWASNNPRVASVDEQGNVTGTSVGVAVIQASADGKVGTAAVQVTALQTAQRSGPTQRQAAPPAQNPPAAQPSGNGTIKLGTRGDAAVFYVNNVPQGTISGLQDWTVPAGNVRLSIRAAGCTNWDTTLTVTTGATVRIGYRSPTCGG
jgi:hypothetical protein